MIDLRHRGVEIHSGKPGTSGRFGQDDRCRRFTSRRRAGCAGELHFAIIKKNNADQNETKRPEAGHYAASLIFGGKPKLQPTRPSRGYGQHGERDVTQLGEEFFFKVSEAMGMGEE